MYNHLRVVNETDREEDFMMDKQSFLVLLESVLREVDIFDGNIIINIDPNPNNVGSQIQRPETFRLILDYISKQKNYDNVIELLQTNKQKLIDANVCFNIIIDCLPSLRDFAVADERLQFDMNQYASVFQEIVSGIIENGKTEKQQNDFERGRFKTIIETEEEKVTLANGMIVTPAEGLYNKQDNNRERGEKLFLKEDGEVFVINEELVTIIKEGTALKSGIKYNIICTLDVRTNQKTFWFLVWYKLFSTREFNDIKNKNGTGYQTDGFGVNIQEVKSQRRLNVEEVEEVEAKATKVSGIDALKETIKRFFG